MFRFGSSHYDDPDRDRRLSSQLFDLFRTNWHKQETALGPHERTKTISYVEHYTQHTPVGELVRRSTCVQHTCTVRMLGGLEGLRSKLRLSDASLGEKSESQASSSSNSPSPVAPGYEELLSLEVSSAQPEVPRFSFSGVSEIPRFVQTGFSYLFHLFGHSS
ncbi:putative guanine-nucleotide-exchange-factor [Fasciolopsis buskii]|uniref:Putative guanine-nucleotide-exchange-factor n=1 Tax=Fasciolopsis buskii TaxID=27845 RepID=A0A8E0RSF9_9TREM|nr:putative guanine-nucleotide-exchange-factor [Fasciolopsis buski]